MAVLSAGKAQQATRAAQRVMAKTEPKLIVDGHWGKFTQKVYSALPAVTQKSVQLITASYGPDYTPANLAEHFAADKAKSKAAAPELISVEKARALVERAAEKLGARTAGIQPSDLAIVMWFEAARRRVDGATFFNAAAVNSLGYTGLYQFSRRTWEDVRARSKIAELGDFSNATNAWMNTLAMVAYAKLNIITLRNKGYKGPIDARTIYGCHQQGAGGFLHFKRTGTLLFPEQSAESIAFLRNGSLPSYVV